jgi:transposase
VDHGYTCLEADRPLGIAQVSNVTRWMRPQLQDQEDLSKSGATPWDLKAEDRRLKKENKRLEIEREILKKAAAFFAKESS